MRHKVRFLAKQSVFKGNLVFLNNRCYKKEIFIFNKNIQGELK